MTLSNRNSSISTSNRKTIRLIQLGLVAVAVALIMSGTASAEDYPSGAGALEQFDAEARAAVPPALKAWLLLLLGTFAVSLIFAWKKVEARWALGGLVAAMVAGPPVFNALGWPMLGGGIALWHLVCWTPVLVVLLLKRPFMNKTEGKPYRIWTAMLVAVIVISFFFDIRDAWIYIQHIRSIEA